MGQWPPGNPGTSRCKPLKLTQTSTHRHTQTRTLARTQNILRVRRHTATTHKHRHIDTYTTSARVAARSLDTQTHAERQRHASTNRRTDAPCIQVAGGSTTGYHGSASATSHEPGRSLKKPHSSPQFDFKLWEHPTIRHVRGGRPKAGRAGSQFPGPPKAPGSGSRAPHTRKRKRTLRCQQRKYPNIFAS